MIMKKNIKALAADIDMTLCAKGGNLPQITIDAFEELHKQGVKLGLATGREVTDQLKGQGKAWRLSFEFDFIIGMNGGMVYDLNSDKHYIMDLLTTDELKDILYYLKPLVDQHHIAVNAEGGGNHNAMNIQNELLESARRHGFMFEDKTGDIEGFCEKPAFKLLFRTEPETSALIRKAVHEKYDKYQTVETFPGTIEVMEKGIDKGSGMKMYAGWNDIDMKDVIAFGDNENDNTLLEAAGCGVCLKDGNENTKKIANDVTDYNCEDGGVGHYIFDHVL